MWFFFSFFFKGTEPGTIWLSEAGFVGIISLHILQTEHTRGAQEKAIKTHHTIL